MIETGDDLSFGKILPGVAAQSLDVGHLDRHGPLQLFVDGQIHQAEAASAQQPLDSIAANMLGQRLGSVADLLGRVETDEVPQINPS